MANKFNQYTSGGEGDSTNGSLDIWGFSLRASNLDSNTAIKSNSIGQLISSNLNISDVNNLQSELDATIQNPNNSVLVTDGLTVTTGNILKTDEIHESTLGTNINLANDLYTNNIIVTGANELKTNSISEASVAAGVTIQNELKVDSIDSKGGAISVSFPSNLNSADIICDNLREKTLLAGVTCQHNLHMNSKVIDEVNEIKVDSIDSKAGAISVSFPSNLNSADIICDNLREKTLLGGVTCQNNLNMNNNNIININDISAVNANFSTTTNARGQLNYAKNALDGLIDVGRWTVSDGIKGLILDNSSGGNVTKKFYSPTTSTEARTVSVAAGSGILNLSGNTTNDIKTAFVSFPQTDIVVPSNSVGRIRVSSSGVVSFSALAGVNTSRFFVLAEVATDTDSLLFIDNKKFVSTNYHNNVYSNNLDIGTYFIEGSVQPIEQNITPLKLNSSYIFQYTFNGIKYTGSSKNEINFWRFYRDTGEVLSYKQLGQTLFIDNQYDNGTNSLVVVPDGFYKKDLFYYVQTDEQLGENYKFMLIYSTDIYPTLKEAEYAVNPPIPSFFSSGAVQLCALITSVNNGGATVVLENIQDARKFINNTIPYAATDDHSQYLLIDGSRSMTGNLDMNGFTITNLELIDGLQPSGGLYSKVDSNVFPNPPATLPVLPTDILSVGTDFGSRDVPENTFKAGSLFSFKIGGSLTCANNDLFTLSVGSNCGATIAAGSFVIGKQYVIVSVGTTDFTLIGSANNNIGTAFIATGIGSGTGTAVEVVIFCNQVIQVEGNQTNSYYELEIDFAVRAIGIAGVAQMLTNGSFDYFNNTNNKKGYGFNFLNNQTFDTTILNQLCILYNSNDVDAFTIDVASITKFY